MRFVKLREHDEPEEGLDIGDYLRSVETKWATLLSSTPGERVMQEFIERHPCLLPDPYRAFGRGHHGVMTGLVYSQPLLPGPRSFRPDFMYIAMDSSGVFPTLIEIEAPTKRHATKAGLPTHDLTQARAQLTDWSDWFESPENQIAFRKLYGITDELVRVRRLRPRYVLLYGRRHEAHANPRFARTRAASGRPDTMEMTYDRLEPNRYSAGAPVVRMDTQLASETRFRVLSVSQVPDSILFSFIDTKRVVGLKEALDTQAGLSPARRAWLLRKAGSYWRSGEDGASPASATDPDYYDDDGDED